MKKAYVLMAIVLAISVVYSCKKKSKSEVSNYNPTPFALQYPDFVTSNIGTPVIPADNPTTAQGILLGRKLFYDMRLSADQTLNCSSCHSQNNSFDDSNQFSKGISGGLGTRNAMALVNLAWGKSFFWDGRSNSLETQAHDPVVNPIEMGAQWPVVMKRLQEDVNYPELFFQAFGTKIIDSSLVTKAIAQFERTLISYNSVYDQVVFLKTKTFSFKEANGYLLFQQAHCVDCHVEGQFTDQALRNNGLDLVPLDSGLAKFTHIPADYGKFKVPSLRNVALTAPYMHDGRFQTLEEVLGFYNGGIVFDSPNIDSNMQHMALNVHFTIQQMADIILFLKTLTDSSYITNPQYSKL